jgi:hypothetical protein
MCFFCCFLRFDFVNWLIIFLLVDHQFEVEEVFLLRKKNAAEVFSFHLLSVCLSVSLSLEAPIWQLTGADQ